MDLTPCVIQSEIKPADCNCIQIYVPVMTECFAFVNVAGTTQCHDYNAPPQAYVDPYPVFL